MSRGEEPADLLLTGARVLNVFTGQVRPAAVAIAAGRIAAVDTESRRRPWRACVPCCGATTSAAGELTGWRAVLEGDRRLAGFLAEVADAGLRIDGHAPGASARTLAQQIGLGIASDHEAIDGVLARRAPAAARAGRAALLALLARDGSWAVGTTIDDIDVRGVASTFTGSRDVLLVPPPPPSVSLRRAWPAAARGRRGSHTTSSNGRCGRARRGRRRRGRRTRPPDRRRACP